MCDPNSSFVNAMVILSAIADALTKYHLTQLRVITPTCRLTWHLINVLLAIKATSLPDSISILAPLPGANFQTNDLPFFLTQRARQ